MRIADTITKIQKPVKRDLDLILCMKRGIRLAEITVPRDKKIT
jgi:hypothetical protein